MKLYHYLTGVIVAIALQGVSAPQGVAQQLLIGPPPDTSLGAANSLLADSWPMFALETVKQAQNQLSTVNSNFLDASGNGWEFSLGLSNLALNTDGPLQPPGFLSESFDGFSLRAPLSGSWSFNLSGTLNAHAYAGTSNTIGGTTFKTTLINQTVPVPFALQISEVWFAASAAVARNDPSRPVLANAHIECHVTIGGTVLFPPVGVGLVLERQPDHSLRGEIPLTRELGIPDFVSVGLGGKLVVRLLPISKTGVWIMLVGLEAAVEIQFPDPVGHVSVPSAPFAWIPIPIPSLSWLGEYIVLAAGPMPLIWPPPGSLPPPPGTLPGLPASPIDFATPRDAIEAGIAATHMPYGAVLSIDYPQLNPIPNNPCPCAPSKPKPAFTYGIDADSTIWTGHYLAAEAFRYAVRQKQEALDKVRSLIGGLQNDFDVTTDAALQDNKYVAVPQDLAGSVFARSALLHSHLPESTLPDWTDSVDARISRGACLYVRPQGGWKLGGRIFPTYAAALGAMGHGIPFRGTPEPVDTADSPVWYGSGCGNRGDDSPISRDQYSGVFMGLALAYALVPDPEVHTKAKAMLDRALDFLVIHHWNVPLPPDGTILTSFLGDFDAQLALLRIGAAVDPTHVPTNTSQSYQQLYATFSPASALCWIPVWMSTVDPMESYYKYNLGHAFLGPALFFETDPVLRANYTTAYRILRAATSKDRNAYFNLVDILVGAANAATLSDANPSITLGDEIVSDLSDWIVRWMAVKKGTEMPRNSTSVGAAAYLAQLWPKYVKTYTGTNNQPSWHSTYPLPLQDRIGTGMEFVWQSPASDVGVDPPGVNRRVPGPGTILPIGRNEVNCSTAPPTRPQIIVCSTEQYQEGPGVDFLLPYWLGVYLHVLPVPPAN